jgi:hypothetical protein
LWNLPHRRVPCSSGIAQVASCLHDSKQLLGKQNLFNSWHGFAPDPYIPHTPEKTPRRLALCRMHQTPFHFLTALDGHGDIHAERIAVHGLVGVG